MTALCNSIIIRQLLRKTERDYRSSFCFWKMRLHLNIKFLREFSSSWIKASSSSSYSSTSKRYRHFLLFQTSITSLLQNKTTNNRQCLTHINNLRLSSALILNTMPLQSISLLCIEQSASFDYGSSSIRTRWPASPILQTWSLPETTCSCRPSTPSSRSTRASLQKSTAQCSNWGSLEAFDQEIYLFF